MDTKGRASLLKTSRPRGPSIHHVITNVLKGGFPILKPDSAFSVREGFSCKILRFLFSLAHCSYENILERVRSFTFKFYLSNED